MTLLLNKSTIHGRGVITAQRCAPDDLLFTVNVWATTEQPIHYLNHSCTPNAVFDGFKVRAFRALERYEEITADYGAIPFPCKAWDFVCACGAAGCRGRIQGGVQV